MRRQTMKSNEDKRRIEATLFDNIFFAVLAFHNYHFIISCVCQATIAMFSVCSSFVRALERKTIPFVFNESTYDS